MDFNKKTWQWIVLIFLALIWGSSFILMKKSLLTFSFMQVGSMRIFFAFLFFIPFIIKKFKNLNRKNIISILIVGFIGNAIPAVLFAKAQTDVDSSLAGMLNATVPIFVWIIGISFYKAKTKFINMVGLFIGLIGAAGLIIKDYTNVFENFNLYALYILVATLFYGINTNEVKYKLHHLDAMSVTALAFLFIGPTAGFYLLFEDFSTAIANPKFYESLLYVVILAFFSSFIAVVIFNKLIKFTSAIFAASVTYIIPIFAIIFGLIDGETITVFQIIFMIIIFAGVFLIKNKKLIKND